MPLRSPDLFLAAWSISSLTNRVPYTRRSAYGILQRWRFRNRKTRR